MASAQVLPNSKKLGHLEAGKKKLEEFRRKKAVGRAKKAASTGQLIVSDVDQHEIVSQKHDLVKDGAKSASDTDSNGSGIPGGNKAVNLSQSTEVHSSNRMHGSSPVLVDSSQASYGGSVQYAGNEVPNLYEKADFPQLVNGYYDQWQESRELGHKKDTIIEQYSGNTDQFVTFNPVKANPNLDMNVSSLSSHSFFGAPPGEDRYASKAPTSNFGTSFPSSSNSYDEMVDGQNLSGFPSTSTSSLGLHKEKSAEMELPYTGSLCRNNVNDIGRGGGKLADSTDYNLNVDSARWHASEPSYGDSSFAYKSTQYEAPFTSSSFGTNSNRSRPSFLDSLGASRGSSMAYVPYREPEKANIHGSFDISNSQSTDAPLSSPARPFAEFNTVDHSLESFTPDSKSDMEVSMNTFVSSHDGKLLNPAGDDHAQRDHEFTSKKDEDFAALEQHIEDLTQEKFSLQRALETSRTLAESLAAENSSLTESYNQQGQIVSQLKSDMGRLQEEIKAQLLAIESIRSEYVHAQMECNAADERAKILTSEVIGLEEKALRLRSNELKLEKQMENLNSEITSYKRKVSILEKERQDFQFTIDALQEEKKLLQIKLRKVPANEKVDAEKTSTGRDVSTSTDDLGTEPFDVVGGETRTAERMLHNIVNQAQDTVMGPMDASTSSLVHEDLAFVLPDASGYIPHDQLRMIKNINSLISELTLEKDELVGALKIESSNCKKLKDFNKDLSQKLEAQTQRLELLTAQRMANENVMARQADTHSLQDATVYADEGDEVVERVLGWIMKLFPGGPSKRRTSKLL
ncbi:uncharacterized protein A4U43_C07F38330 [Asparagus officinalis]|uniref:Uncharacterized protein n=1 Tax=Asparagus officinalis TaxID=4686 RepID=A0A5P1EHZ0_ASPOF|nr:uncharacterized protein LOC109850218 [Asparagus officinalis]ONK65558.1 uncharacterized protein A4U43_C07F38330 [Asparagus officinalis]